MSSPFRLSIPTLVGTLTISERDGAIVALDWGAAPVGAPTPLLRRAHDQLAEYFAGERRAFDLPLAPAGSSFQRRVWDAMLAIPYGSTRSYGEVAGELGSAARAVGGACGANPIPILIPCHRILAANGLGGYSGGTGPATKRALLALEAGRPALPLAPPAVA